MRFVFASSSAFCNANNNGNANNNSAGNADNYVRPRFEWRAVTVERPMRGATCYVDSGRYRESPAPRSIEEARKGCRLFRVVRFDVVHDTVYPCCKSAHSVPYAEYVMWQGPVCDDCVPFGADTADPTG